MASIKFDEYKVKLNNLEPVLEKLGASLNLDAARRELDMLEAQATADGFWNDMKKAQRVTLRIKQLQDKLEAQNKRHSQLEDLMVLCEMGIEEDDDSMLEELEEGYSALEASLEAARMETLFTGE